MHSVNNFDLFTEILHVLLSITVIHMKKLAMYNIYEKHARASDFLCLINIKVKIGLTLLFCDSACPEKREFC